MSDFFDSEIIQDELKEINELQERIYGSLFNFSSMSKEDRLHHVEILSDLLEKQRVMYTRLSLSDDPKACLLYTSPSPRDAHESRMPSSA